MPELGPGTGIQRKNNVEGRRKVKGIAREDGGGFKRRPLHLRVGRVHGMGVKGPNWVQLTQVAAIDLRGCRKPQATWIAAIRGPAFSDRR
jgi:hypothetical protein